MTPAPRPEAGHKFDAQQLVCQTCAMPHYVFLSARRPKCGSPEAAAVMRRYAEAMGRMSA